MIVGFKTFRSMCLDLFMIPTRPFPSFYEQTPLSLCGTSVIFPKTQWHYLTPDIYCLSSSGNHDRTLPFLPVVLLFEFQILQDKKTTLLASSTTPPKTPTTTSIPESHFSGSSRLQFSTTHFRFSLVSRI